VSIDDFERDFLELSGFGKTPLGGVDRQAATDEHRQASEWFTSWLQARSFEVKVDEIGNIFGLLEWHPGAPYVLAGSHLDSQPLAGRFDGAYGVLAAMHAADELRRRVAASGELPPFNLGVVSWFNEEGSRFKPSMMGSGVFAGIRALDTALASADPTGTTVTQALHAQGMAGTAEPPMAAAYAEIHIEQGRKLERHGADIGLVTGNWCARKYHVVVSGEQSHTGATLLTDRRDALLGAAHVITVAREVVERQEPGTALASVGEISVSPNVAGVIAREAELFLDVRSHRMDILEHVHQQIKVELSRIEEQFGVQIHLLHEDLRKAVVFSDKLIAVADESVRRLGLTPLELLTMAGHDSVNLTQKVPTVMLFIPSKDGISHNEREASDTSEMWAGVEVLREVLDQMSSGKADLPTTSALASSSAGDILRETDLA
jgi:beta-ureidopropionase / N-carbamoyl-L-amino-acid hydrolase